MKSFFLSIIAALGSFFGMHSQAVMPVSATSNISAVSMQAQSTSTVSTSVRSNTLSASTTPITPPVITFPSGGSVLHPGQTYAVTWQNKDPRPISYSVNLEFVANGNYYAMLSVGTISSAAQTLAFKVPSGMSSTTNYQLYFSNAANKSDVIVGSQAFSIR